MRKKTKGSTRWVNKAKNQNIKNYAGTHLIADFWNGKIIENKEELKKILIKAAKEGKNQPLEVVIHKFPFHGLTGVVLLAESHIALHSWPEFNYLAIDIFTCGNKTMPYQALDYLKKEFRPKKVKIRKIKRGILK